MQFSNTRCPFPVNPCSHPQPQATSDLLSVSRGLPFVGIFYTWAHNTLSFAFIFFHVACF